MKTNGLLFLALFFCTLFTAMGHTKDDLMQRGKAHLEKKEVRAALKGFNAYLKLDPSRADGCLMRAILSHKPGLHHEARPGLEKAIEVNPKKEEAFYCRALTYKDRQKYPKALAGLQQVLVLAPGT